MERKKIVFIGPMGAGKSTAINAVSDIPTVSTEAANSDVDIVNKATTTVAMDYGELHLDSLTTIGLYGIPGQRRFDFIWPVVSKGALGAILLLDASHSNSWDDLRYFLKAFSNFVKNNTLIIGLNRVPKDERASSLETCQTIFQEEKVIVPVFVSDPRVRNDVAMLLETLVATVETRLFLGESL